MQSSTGLTRDEKTIKSPKAYATLAPGNGLELRACGVAVTLGAGTGPREAGTCAGGNQGRAGRSRVLKWRANNFCGGTISRGVGNILSPDTGDIVVLLPADAQQ